MRTAVDQLPLFRRLPIPPSPPPKPRVWMPVSWQRAVAALLRLRQQDLPLPQRRGPQNRVKWTLDPSTLPYAVKPSKVIWMIQTAPPPKPLCYDSMEAWKEYLMLLHAEGQQITRRQNINLARPGRFTAAALRANQFVIIHVRMHRRR